MNRVLNDRIPATPQMGGAMAKKKLVIAIFAAFAASQVWAADSTEIATSALEFGGSLGKLLWVSVADRNKVNAAQSNAYETLAYRVKEQIDLGRASSSLVKANFNVVGTTLAYAAAVDPEPLSKVVTGIAAWGAKKTGDAIGELVIEESQKQSQAILAQGLKNSGISIQQLSAMPPDELGKRVSDLKIGGERLKDILKDDPKSLALLQANAVDIATNIGVAALAKATGTAATVKDLRKDLNQTRENLSAYQEVVTQRLESLDSSMAGLAEASRISGEKLDKLKTEVQGNSKAIQTLAQISSSSWTTSQKLQAVQSGLFPDLTPSQKKALVESLESDRSREAIVTGIQTAARDFGNLASIAKNIGLPADVATTLQGAQIVATGIAQYATGDYLGAISSITSLAGLGAPDAATQRHAAMMKYLQQEFAVVNQKLDKIIDLQVQTLKAVAALAEEQRQFRGEVLGKFDQLEDAILRSEQILQAILLSQWTECHAMINGSFLNGQYAIANRSVLSGLLGTPSTQDYIGRCYVRMAGFLDAWVKPAKWSGQIIAAGNFPAEAIASDPALQKGWAAYQAQKSSAYSAARDFLLASLTDAGSAPAGSLARISQPVVDVAYSNQLEAALAKPELSQRFQAFKCSEHDVLSPALKQLLCFGQLEDSPTAPLADRWQELMSTSLIGPHAIRLIDTGITLSSLVDFAKYEAGTFSFVGTKAIDNFAKNGLTNDLRVALAQNKGRDLLNKIRWLAEASVLQQSVAYGDFTARRVELTLYDPQTHSLNLDPKVMTPLKQLAVSAMRANPTLARNVVMLAMRHAIADGLGGAEAALAKNYRSNFYGLALADYAGPQACNGSAFPKEKLRTLFQNWEFSYFVSSAAKEADAALATCPTEFSNGGVLGASTLPLRGSGVAVSLADFYVIVPSVVVLSGGIFEQTESLRLSLVYRDRVAQALVDRDVSNTVKGLFPAGPASNALVADTSFAILNEGWGWQVRAKSK